MALATSTRSGTAEPEFRIELSGEDDRLAPGDWVQAQPFRLHVRHLMAATGLPWRALSRLAGASPYEVQGLLQGNRDGRAVRKIRLDLARRLYALTPDSILAARRTMVRVDQSAAGLERLAAAGWTITELSSRIRLSAELLLAIAEGRRPVCSRLVEARILAAAETLGSLRPESTPAPRVRRAGDPAEGTAELETTLDQAA